MSTKGWMRGLGFAPSETTSKLELAGKRVAKPSAGSPAFPAFILMLFVKPFRFRWSLEMSYVPCVCQAAFCCFSRQQFMAGAPCDREPCTHTRQPGFCEGSKPCWIALFASREKNTAAIEGVSLARPPLKHDRNAAVGA